jgi:succinate dehydrogenase/fumarate reductase flavoprotein subunit
VYEKIFDVIVVGGGNAGLISAISAIEHGAKSLLLIERAPEE